MSRKRRTPAERLIDEVGRYVAASGGSALVGGPIEVQVWPGDPSGVFRVSVKVTGSPPVSKVETVTLGATGSGK